jgi:fluoride ion exporter CrcB/FEX
MGALLRLIIAQLFGEACANPGTVGWLSAAAPLCVTKDGDTQQQGGIVFADLPSNLLGSFLMGLWQDATVLGLAVPMAVAWLSPHNRFQTCGIIHKAFTTGFCGSLTTFSSWNSEMVVMIFLPDKHRHTQIWSALFGYIIGTETAVGSFACGCSLARFLHRSINPVLAAEEDSMEVRKEQGVHLNRDLPDFERRYLHQLEMPNVDSETSGIFYGQMLYPVGRIDSLERWRSSVASVRRVGHQLLPVLIEVENSVLVLQKLIPPEAESVARAEGWELDSLLQWASAKADDLPRLPSVSSSISLGSKTLPVEDSRWFQLPVALGMLCVVMIALLVSLLLMQGEEATTITNRTMVYAMLFAPAGAVLRWKLSAWNGNFPYEGWRWFPAGTFAVNIIGSIVCIIAVALEYKLESIYDVNTFWSIGTIRAIKVGFSGCLTTVSTFVAEISGFMRTKTDHAYPYILTTLTTSCAISCLIFGLIVYVF